MKVVKFLIKLIIVLLVLAVIAEGTIVVLQGINLYNTAMQKEDLLSRVNAVRSSNEYVEIEYISDYFLDAIVAVEDKTFYEHSGIAPKSIIRAMIADIRNKDFKEGASTITQQVAKNLCFSSEKSLSRKIAEYLVVRDLERLYTKQEILELYVNIIYYGDGYTGVGPACDGYFKAEPSELTLDEATLLAGLPQAPSTYALSEHRDKALERRVEVVEAMISCGYLSEEDASIFLDN